MYTHDQLMKINKVLEKLAETRKLQQVQINGYALLSTQICNEHIDKYYVSSSQHFLRTFLCIFRISRFNGQVFCGSLLWCHCCVGSWRLHHRYLLVISHKKQSQNRILLSKKNATQTLVSSTTEYMLSRDRSN